MHVNYRRSNRTRSYLKWKASTFRKINASKRRAQETRVLQKGDFDALDAFEPVYVRGEDLWGYI